MSTEKTALGPLRKFRLTAIRFALVATGLAAVAAYFMDPIAAQGVLLGGIAGVLGFWIIAVRLEKLALLAPAKVNFAALTWTFFRFLLYGVVLFKAYTLDSETYHGLVGALVGILLMRFVLLFLGITGIDLATPGVLAKRENSEDDHAQDT